MRYYFEFVSLLIATFRIFVFQFKMIKLLVLQFGNTLVFHHDAISSVKMVLISTHLHLYMLDCQFWFYFKWKIKIHVCRVNRVLFSLCNVTVLMHFMLHYVSGCCYEIYVKAVMREEARKQGSASGESA